MKDIPGYEGYYAITEDGQVWSYYKRNFLALILDTKGYYVVNLLKKENENDGEFIVQQH